MTPTETVLIGAGALPSVADSDGRRIAVRRLSALDKLRLFKAAGPTLAQNEPWLGIAVLAYCVTAIDDVPVPTPANESQIEALVARLGDAGIEAVAATLDTDSNAMDQVATAGN